MKISTIATFITYVLGTAATLLILASIGGQYSRFYLGHDGQKGLIPLFFVDAERNIPTFFSVTLMILIAFLIAVIVVLNLNKKGRYTSKWVLLSLGFMYMAFDEELQVHERLISPLRRMMRMMRMMDDGDLGIFYFTWVIPAIVLIIILGLFFLRFLVHLDAQTRLRFLTAAIVYIGGAVGLELIGGGYCEAYGTKTMTYSMIVTLEEGLEMAGLILFIRALLKHLDDNHTELRLIFDT